MIEISENVDIKDYSSLRIGGKFRYFAVISSIPDIIKSCDVARAKKIKIFILGEGSNVVFSEGIIDIITLKIEIKGFEIVNDDYDHTIIKVGAGEIWDNIVRKTVEMNLSGLEALSAIPGTVGATPVQNVGAYGAEVKDTILEVEVFEIENNKIKILSNEDCKFGYRDSIFKNEAKNKYIITAVTYRLLKTKEPSKNFSPAFKYPGVTKYFEDQGIKNPTLQQIREAIIDIRREKLPDPKKIPNVGSFFKNPIVENEVAEKIKKNFSNTKFFPIDEKYTKIPAGWLIESAGLKGKSFGSVTVYDKNALVLVNNGNATKDDLMRVKDEIVKIVKEKFGVTLEQEPEII